MNINFREYKDIDLVKCADMALEAWPIAKILVNKNDINKIMIAYIKLSLLLSDYTEICYMNGIVLGFLFGTTNISINIKKQIQLYRLFWQFIRGKYGKIKHPLLFAKNFLFTSIKVNHYCKKFDSEIVLFVVSKEYRGQGIGKKLICNYIEYLKKMNKKTMYVHTDIESNWRFYKKYGFIKYKDFYDNELSYLRKQKLYSYIYYYNL